MPTTIAPIVPKALAATSLPARSIVARTRGAGHGSIVRLMSPSDLGQQLKPFVFLDLFDADSSFAGAMPVHPHSGIATVTLLVEGNLRFDDPHSNTAGTIGNGGVEWMRAGNGVWHGQEMTPGTSPRMRGFQLWVALPPEIENGPVDRQYLEAEQVPTVGPARLILGSYGGRTSPVRSPEGINYLLVTLQPGERWTYLPPPGHRNAFVSISRGTLSAPEAIAEGELAVFAPSEKAITFDNGADEPAVFVLGSAVPHPHELALGYYCVHTSDAALARGEARIAELSARMLAAGAPQPACRCSAEGGRPRRRRSWTDTSRVAGRGHHTRHTVGRRQRDDDQAGGEDRGNAREAGLMLCPTTIRNSCPVPGMAATSSSSQPRPDRSTT